MVIGGIAEVLFGVDAEGRSLESIARPLHRGGELGGSLQDQAAVSTA